MRLEPYQACRTTEGWMPVRIPSSTDEGIYQVLVCPWENPRENICECPAYFYRGQCRHQEEAQHFRCDWTELQVDPRTDEPKYAQTPEQRKKKICPRCGGPTMWKMEVDEEEDES